MDDYRCDSIYAVRKQCGSSDSKSQAHRSVKALCGFFFSLFHWAVKISLCCCKFCTVQKESAIVFSVFPFFAINTTASAPPQHCRCGLVAYYRINSRPVFSNILASNIKAVRHMHVHARTDRHRETHRHRHRCTHSETNIQAGRQAHNACIGVSNKREIRIGCVLSMHIQALTSSFQVPFYTWNPLLHFFLLNFVLLVISAEDVVVEYWMLTHLLL